MTIFDTIRTPNPDITDNEELKLIPRPVLEAWIAACLEEKDQSYPTELNLQDPRNDFSIIIANILHTRLSAYDSWKTRCIKNQLWKQRFTDILKKMIADYNPE
jgi:hypothetical protein